MSQSNSFLSSGRDDDSTRELKRRNSTSTSGSSGRTEQVSESDASCLQRHNVKIRGTGKKLLFLAHGFGTNQQVWDGVLQSLDLKTKFRVILWDVMGAYSTNPDSFDFQRYSSLHAHADDLLEVLQELQVKSLVYVGHSVGGMIGLLASLECPHLFRKLIILGSSVRYLNDHATGYRGGFEVNDLDQLFAAMQANYTVWVSGYSAVAVGDSIESPAVREFARTLFLIRPDIAFSTLKMIFQIDFRDILRKIENTVHLITSQDDHAVPLEVTQFMAQSLPNCTVEVLPLAGHLPHLTHPALVAEVLTRHVAM